VAPRTFFLNETHEHTRGEKGGGGAPATFSTIRWAEKGRRLAQSLKVARAAISKSRDPNRETRFFMVSRPERVVHQDSKSKKATNNLRDIKTVFGGEHAKLFEKLDLDLVRVTAQGDAIVHARPAVLDRLEATAAHLDEVGSRERARWAFLRDFSHASIETRIDLPWLANLGAKDTHEAIVEFQPVLTRAEVDTLISVLGTELSQARGESILGAGRDLSGRRWLRVRARPSSIRSFAEGFQSIQSIHAPLRATLFAAGPHRPPAGGARLVAPANLEKLPAVAVLDAGIPREHPVLAPYRRGEYRHAQADQIDPGDHGSRVASRVVFGDVAAGPPTTPGPGRCRFLDVVLPLVDTSGPEPLLDGKAVFDVLRATIASYTDVRVFNLSFGSYVPLERLLETERFETLAALQDLDNFAFEHDAVVVVAAGNTQPGVIPATPYPAHIDEPDWRLGAWAAGFNTIVVGGYLSRVYPDGLVALTGWPSAFTRIGPGVANAPVPNYAAGAGDCTQNYQWGPGLGVETLNRDGLWEDAVGTSHAAPIVAREAALLLQSLERYCGPPVRPFSSTAKAFMRLVARHVTPAQKLSAAAQKLAARTLGAGLPSAVRLDRPLASSAVFLWQGTLDEPGEVARVRLPIPRGWLKEAKVPRLRTVCAWNTPVSAAAPEVWASRRVSLQVRPGFEAQAPRAHGRSIGAYPMIDRTYDLDEDHLAALNIEPADDEWILEVSYEEVGPYPVGVTVNDQQRVSVVWELFDEATDGVSPQELVQEMISTADMIRLGGSQQAIWSPIRIPTS
jgi:hypothetical protein